MARYIDAVIGADIISGKLNIPLDDLVDVFAQIPTADVEEVKHGKWIRGGVWGDTGSVAYKCSVCRETTYDGKYFECCPHCGAKMNGGNAE